MYVPAKLLSFDFATAVAVLLVVDVLDVVELLDVLVVLSVHHGHCAQYCQSFAA
ncbi:MAG: hypothetical protein LUF89_09280 [Ruminococcus sp.]|nr:hypothetical protein [Ruminococcus sp.]